MRFLIGLVVGFGVGFAVAVLYAPERTKRPVGSPLGTVDSGPPGLEEDHNIMGALQRALQSLQDQVNEAMGEAKKAQQETEAEMRVRYERTARRKVEEERK